MNSSWQTDGGHLACRWSEAKPHPAYNAAWMQETHNAPSGYLTPSPDFASHSPFGGAFWFEPIRLYRYPE